MLQALHTKFSGNLYHGIEVTGLYDNKLSYYLTSLKASKNELLLEHLTDDEHFFKLKKGTINACLIINTDQVLSRKTAQSSNEIKQIVEGSFPNLDLDQFYYQSHKLQDQQFVSIARRNHIDAIVKNLANKNIYVSNIILGNTIAFSLEKFSRLKQVKTSNSLVTWEEDMNIHKQEDLEPVDYSIENIEIPNTHILSFLGAIDQHSSHFEADDNLASIIEPYNKEYKHFIIFYYGIRSAVALLLITLMLNFYYFNKYYDFISNNPKVNNEDLKNTYTKLKSQVDQQNKLINQILYDQTSSTSYVVNDIIKTLPANTQLSEIAYQPPERSIKKNKPVELNLGEITIKGDTGNNDNFAYWNNDLEQMEWVENVTIVEFNTKDNSDRQKFELKIEMNK